MRGPGAMRRAWLGWGLLISRSDVSGHQNPAILDQLAQTN
jgi:hypothetical protein